MLECDSLSDIPLDVARDIAMRCEWAWIQLYVYNEPFAAWSRQSNSIQLFIKLFEKSESNDRYHITKILNFSCKKYVNGITLYRKNKILHRLDGPAKETGISTEWYKDGKLHRLDGPALIYNYTGSVEYYMNGERHREDGPAFISKTGYQAYYIGGKRHRLDGPAIIHPDGREVYYINDKHIRL